MAIFFTSDTHFFHEPALRASRRPWDNMQSMCDAMSQKWNARIRDEDTVYILGDFCSEVSEESIKFIKRLRGKKILIRGNHDPIRINPELEKN